MSNIKIHEGIFLAVIHTHGASIRCGGIDVPFFREKMIVKQYTRSGSVYRPVINWKNVILRFVLAILLTIGLTLAIAKLLEAFAIEESANRILSFIGAVFFLPGDNIRFKLFFLILIWIVLLRLKHILIFFVYLYQKYASESTRSLCRFRPSCSQYTIMALEKYGAIIGTYKGFKRFMRCRAPNGGYDYP